MSLEHVRQCLYLEVEVGTPIDVGNTPSAKRRFIPLVGGTFRGDAEGEVLAGGADWQTVRPDGTLEIAAHYLLKARAGGLIEVSSIGLRSAAAEVLERLGRGEAVPSEAYYFRTHVTFRTPIPELAHLNNRLYYSKGERKRSLVCLTVFEIL
ncbi:MAG TPA: DUF3237 family protein [Polyangiales bacterium]|jgi:hypothetical protein|nr:DUF3237 family protein [Polyangiales bacterium]